MTLGADKFSPISEGRKDGEGYFLMRRTVFVVIFSLMIYSNNGFSLSEAKIRMKRAEIAVVRSSEEKNLW